MARKSWLITGVSSGFGRMMTERLLERGDRVAGTVRKPEVMDDLRAKYGERLWVERLDLTEVPEIRKVVDAAFAALGRIDVVVNNAGYGLQGAAEELTDEQIDRQIATNLVGSIQVIRAALPHLRAQGGGRVLQVSSTGGQYAFPSFSLYHASKWGVEGFVEAVAKEVKPFGIEMTIAEPGANKTNFTAGIVRPDIMEAYENTPAGQVRRMAEAGQFPTPGDAEKVARTMIDWADWPEVPKRLPMGSDTYGLLKEAFTERLAELESMKEVALGTDRTA